MRIRRVTAHAFGPLQQATLELADGLTVVVGDNESAKSSWHAAIYAALCGRRRGRGRPRADEARFVDLHRPWDGAEWLVGAQIRLDDGRRVELRQDLDGKVDCQATDLDTGQDVSSEIMFEGAPDASRWLGLDRESFLATACVEQAQLLRVRSEASGLAHHLQRAADTAGTESTAATALGLIDDFQREHVGADRVNSSKPLRHALDAHAAAVRALEGARASHDAYLVRRRQADALAGMAEQAEARLAAVEAAVARAEADRLAQRVDRARRLAAEVDTVAGVGGEQDPRLDVPGVHLDVTVAETLVAWRALPAPVALSGPTAEQLSRQLAELPPMPAGDLDPATEVVDAHERLQAAAQALAAQTVTAERGRRLGRWLLLAGAVAGLVGVVVLGAGISAATTGGGGVSSVVGGVVLAVALVAALLGVSSRRRGVTALRAASASAAEATTRVWGTLRERGPLGERAEAATAPSTGPQVTASTGLRVGAQVAAAADAFAAYVAACRDRAHQAQRAGRRADLTAALDTRREAEYLAEGVARRRSQVVAEVVQTAVRVGAAPPGVEPDVAADRLDEWRRQQHDRRDQLDRARQAQAELAGHLGGASLPDLEEQAARARQRADRLAADLNARWPHAAGDPEQVMADALADDELPRWKDIADERRDASAQAAGELRQLAASLPTVADAEEALARAQAELERVRELAETLGLAREFLARAEDRVHHDIAPVLADTLRPWLPVVTEGRYTDVTIDPSSLEVRVCGPTRRWQAAERLSHGTAEQIYLLLRLALVEHLTRGHDTSPLLLDEVTVYSDPRRTRALLDLLAAIARDRQVVLFTQEEQVAQWAREHLPPEGRLLTMPVVELL